MSKRGPKPVIIPGDLIARYQSGELNSTELARLCGIHPDTALVRLREAGVDTSHAARMGLYAARHPERSRRRDRAVRLYGRGLSLPEIARRLGLTAEGVRYLLIRSGVPRRPAGGAHRRQKVARRIGRG